MYVLTIKTDSPEAEIVLYKDSQRVAYEKWAAHRQLAATIHQKIEEIISREQISLSDISGLVVYRGPGSFTGLRIGITVANALADSLNVPIMGTTGGAWDAEGLTRLTSGQNDKIVLPEYGAPPRITKQKK
jgi:tRNA threonylcarbamoyladenosine biosynthesis protein TsaB